MREPEGWIHEAEFIEMDCYDHLNYIVIRYRADVGSESQPDHSYVPRRAVVPDEKTAIRIAEAVLFPVYGEEPIKREEPFRITLVGDVWTVEEKELPPDAIGGVLHLEISKLDGHIIQMIHGQ